MLSIERVYRISRHKAYQDKIPFASRELTIMPLKLREACIIVRCTDTDKIAENQITLDSGRQRLSKAGDKHQAHTLANQYQYLHCQWTG